MIGSVIAGVVGELAVDRIPLLWLEGVLLFGALAAIGTGEHLSRSTGYSGRRDHRRHRRDHVRPRGLGPFWPDAEFLQPYSLFHYYQPKEILAGTAPAISFLLPAAVGVVAVAWSLFEFPRRDLLGQRRQARGAGCTRPIPPDRWAAGRPDLDPEHAGAALRSFLPRVFDRRGSNGNRRTEPRLMEPAVHSHVLIVSRGPSTKPFGSLMCRPG